MGLLIDKPGDLIDINENEILPPPRTAGGEDNFCISGMIEVEGVLYRIINIDSIVSLFDNEGENAVGTIM
jgi:chemotaxis signal transduction protein